MAVGGESRWPPKWRCRRGPSPIRVLLDESPPGGGRDRGASGETGESAVIGDSELKREMRPIWW